MTNTDKFEIHEFDPLLSDVHCRASVFFNCTFESAENNEQTEQDETLPERAMQPRKWDHNRSVNFHNSIAVDKIDELTILLNNDTEHDVNKIIKKLKDIWPESAVKIFGKRKSSRNKPKTNRASGPNQLSNEHMMKKRLYIRPRGYTERAAAQNTVTH